MEIIPAIMPTSFEDLHDKALSVRGLVKTVQIDVMDGKFVPPLGWPLREGDTEGFQKIIDGEISLPFWKEINYEVDLMVRDPEKEMGAWVSAGFRRAIVHVESTSVLEGLLEEWRGTVELGIAVNIDTEASAYQKFVEKADFVQLMGIAKIGYQGMPFDIRVLDNISSLRKAFPNVIISVDGGVDLTTAPKLLAAGVNRLCVGSALWKNENIEVEIKKFQALKDN
ncbi:hypothetical protein L0Y69_00175 [bacterium]|nr:hypothetical protein [bacterium]